MTINLNKTITMYENKNDLSKKTANLTKNDFSNRPDEVAEYQQTAVFYDENAFYYGEKIRVKANCDAACAVYDPLKMIMDLTDDSEATKKEKEKIKDAFEEAKNNYEYIKNIYSWFGNFNFDSVSIIDETKIRLVLRKNGVKTELFRETDGWTAEKYADAISVLRLAIIDASDIQCGLAIGDLNEAKSKAKKASKVACDILTGYSVPDNETKVFQLSTAALDLMIDAAVVVKKEKKKNEFTINNKTRLYRDNISNSRVMKMFEDFVAQQLDNMDKRL